MDCLLLTAPGRKGVHSGLGKLSEDVCGEHGGGGRGLLDVGRSSLLSASTTLATSHVRRNLSPRLHLQVRYDG